MKCPKCGHWSFFDFSVCRKCGYDHNLEVAITGETKIQFTDLKKALSTENHEITNLMKIAYDITKNESHAKEKINAIHKLSKLCQHSEAVNDLFLILKDETRGEIALAAAAGLASAIQNNDAQEFIIDKFKAMKNIKKPFGQIPQVRIIYAMIMSGSKDIFNCLNSHDYSDEEPRDVINKRTNLIEAFRKNDVKEVCKSIMWFEALDAACNCSLLELSAGFYQNNRNYFNQIISLSTGRAIT